jgi:hypothetical protein
MEAEQARISVLLDAFLERLRVNDVIAAQAETEKP